MSFELKYRQTRQNFRHCSDEDTFYFRFDILLKLSPKCIHKGAIDIRPSLVQIMAGRPIDDEPLPDAIVNLRPRCATIRVLSCYCNWENEAMIKKWCILSNFHWRLLGSNLQQISIASGPLWRHQTETFFALLSLCVGNQPGTGGFPSQRDSDADLWCFFVVSLNKLLNKHSIARQCETPWRHRNACNSMMTWSPRVTYHPAVGMILCIRPANEGRRYTVTPSLIGWAHTQNDHWPVCPQTPPIKVIIRLLFWSDSMKPGHDGRHFTHDFLWLFVFGD